MLKDNSLRGITSTLILDEVLYKMMLMEASNMNQISLREAPSFLKRFLEKIIARTDKLLPHDASHLAVMESAGVKDIASNDSDFGRVKGIKVWQPSRMRL